jgi:hypothetical protein
MVDAAKAHLLCQHPGMTEEKSGVEFYCGGQGFCCHHTASVTAKKNLNSACWCISLSLFGVALD